MAGADRFEPLRRTRDPELFREFVDEFQERVFRLVVSILGPWSDADAEDVTQDVFLRAYERLRQFRGEASISSWLYRIAWTQAINRKNTSRFRLPHSSLESLALEAGGRQDVVETVDEKMQIAKCMEELPDAYRTTFYLHYWMGSTVDEIGEFLGAPPGTIKSYLSRGRERLRRCLESTEGAGS